MAELKNTTLFREQCYINGKWTGADSKAFMIVTNHADGSRIGTVPEMGVIETRRAIQAAYAAWQPWHKNSKRAGSYFAALV